MNEPRRLEIPSEEDANFLELIRSNVNKLISESAATFFFRGCKVLDIAPQVHEGARPYRSLGAIIETLDIDPSTSPTYVADLCQYNPCIADESFDIIICTEVIEHVRNPFAAAEEMFRILKPGGAMILSTPFNFRIHGPLPDCWRFTEYGLREVLKNFTDVNIRALETPGRPLAPIHYTVQCRKP